MYLERRIYTGIGDLILIAWNQRIVYCNWATEECTPKYLRITNYYAVTPYSFPDHRESENVSLLDKAHRELLEYFAGIRLYFSFPIELTGTEFQRRVWNEIAKIPYGNCLSYKAIAERMKHPKALRAIAQACGANPLAVIVPCHRVVGTKGYLGGYTGGIGKKLRLLELEKDNL